MTLEGLNSDCIKLEPARSKNDEVLKINVLQKSTSRALCQEISLRRSKGFPLNGTESLKAGSHDPIFSLALFQLIEMLILHQ